LYTAVFWISPPVGLLLAAGVAVAKAGTGDLSVMDAITGSRHIQGRMHRLLAGFVRGGVVMILPMVFWPETFYGFSIYIMNVFEMGAFDSYAGSTCSGKHRGSFSSSRL